VVEHLHKALGSVPRKRKEGGKEGEKERDKKGEREGGRKEEREKEPSYPVSFIHPC
jgi:hypothetical protein